MRDNAMATQPVKHEEPTIGRLVSEATRDISGLVQSEIKLAKSELKVSVKNGTTGAVFFGAAAFLAVLAVILLSIAFAHLIHWNGEGLDLHWAYLIVTGVYFLLAGLFAFLGIRKVKKVKAPERSIAQAQKTKAVLKRG